MLITEQVILALFSIMGAGLLLALDPLSGVPDEQVRPGFGTGILLAAERAADAAALAPLFGAAGHVLCGSPLPSVAVAAAAAYSVEMLDLGVRR